MKRHNLFIHKQKIVCKYRVELIKSDALQYTLISPSSYSNVALTQYTICQ